MNGDRTMSRRDHSSETDGNGDGANGSRSLALATLLFVLFLTFLDNTIVTVVLAQVQSDLHASVSQLQWVVNGYALTFAGLDAEFRHRRVTCSDARRSCSPGWPCSAPAR